MKFGIFVSFFGLTLIGISFCLWRILPNNKKLWRIIPRDKYVGTAIGLICLIWSVKNIDPILEGTAAKFRGLLPPAVVVITILSYFLLDYLFTRALGGILLLSVNWLLHESFVIQIPLRPLFSTICYLFGISSFFLIAAPYRFRDLLENITDDSRWRAASSIAMCFIGCLLILVSASHYVR